MQWQILERTGLNSQLQNAVYKAHDKRCPSNTQQHNVAAYQEYHKLRQGEIKTESEVAIPRPQLPTGEVHTTYSTSTELMHDMVDQWDAMHALSFFTTWQTLEFVRNAKAKWDSRVNVSN